MPHFLSNTLTGSRANVGGGSIFTLREYPVRKVLTVHAATTGAALRGEALFSDESLIDPKHYYCLPDVGIHEDIPFSLVLRPPLRLSRDDMAIKVRYVAGLEKFNGNNNFFEPHAMLDDPQTRSIFRVHYLAGYSPGKACPPHGVPADLASACLELAAWNMARYRGPPSRKRVLVGITGNIRGSGKDGEHLESSMPENVRLLLEPYRRKTI
jgi:hypothetical protein